MKVFSSTKKLPKQDKKFSQYKKSVYIYYYIKLMLVNYL